MDSKRPNNLEQRVATAAQEALTNQDFVCPIDVFWGLGWLPASTLKSWRQAQLSSLEEGLNVSAPRIAEAMESFGTWARKEGLEPIATPYVSKTPARAALQFSQAADPALEEFYHTHWVSPSLSPKKREALQEKSAKAPELVVIQPLEDDWKCHHCGATGNLLIMETPGPSCLDCAGLGSLVFLPSGDAGVSRRAKAASQKHALVMRFSSARKRYERQGILVEPKALEKARKA